MGVAATVVTTCDRRTWACLLVQPGAVDTELDDHITDEAGRTTSQDNDDSTRTLHAEDIARAIVDVVTQPDHVAMDEVLVRPTPTSRHPDRSTWTLERT